MAFAYYNGVFGDFNDIKIPLSDRSVFFGDGIYDAAIGRDGNIYQEDLHLARFFGNAKRVGIPVSYTEKELSDLLRETIKRSGIKEFFLYFQATGHLSERVHAPRDKDTSNLLITVKPFSLHEKQKELELVSFPEIRQNFCDIKTLNLLGSVLASERAVSEGCDEAVFVRGETVTECAHSNIFIISDGKLITHPANERILPGITRKTVLLVAKKLGIDTEERPFSLSELFSASDVIITSTSKLALRAKSLDGIALSEQKSRACEAIIDEMFKCYNDFC